MIIWEKINFKEKKRVDNRGFVPESKKKDTRGNKFGKYIGYFDSHYIDSYTFEQFCISIVNSRKFSSAMNVFKRIVTDVRKSFKANGIDNNIERVQAMVMHHIVYEKWIGFVFEYNVKVLLEYKGLKVLETTEYMDRECKIDIVTELSNGKTIGIQCKSQTFLNNRSKDFVHKNINDQRFALCNGLIDEVYYLFHNKNGHIVTVGEQMDNFGKKQSKCFIDIENITNAYKLDFESSISNIELFGIEIDKFKKENTLNSENIISLGIKKALISW